MLLAPGLDCLISSSEHEDPVRHSPLRTVCLGPGIMGVRVVSPVAVAISLNYFRFVSLSLTGRRFCKLSSDSLELFFSFIKQNVFLTCS